MRDIKKHFLLFILFIPFISFSQKKNDFVFKNISFIQKDSLTNLEEYKKGEIAAFRNLLQKMPIDLDEKNMNELDSINNSITQKKLNEYAITYHYKKINDSIIERYEENNNTIGSIFINTKTEKEYYHFPYDKRYDEAFRFPFEKIKDLKTQEFRNDRKTIKGIACFKVICSYTQIIEYAKDEDLPEFNFPDEFEEIIVEMWVVEKNNSIYHPAFKVKEILEHYYPLEIMEKNSISPGMIRVIKLII